MRSVFKLYIKSGSGAGFRLCRFAHRLNAEEYAAKLNAEHGVDLYGVTELTVDDSDENAEILADICGCYWRESWSNPAPDVFRDPTDAPKIPAEYREDFELAAVELAHYVCRNHNFPTLRNVFRSICPVATYANRRDFAYYCVMQSLGSGNAWSDSRDGVILIDAHTVEPPVYDDPEYADRQQE